MTVARFDVERPRRTRAGVDPAGGMVRHVYWQASDGTRFDRRRDAEAYEAALPVQHLSESEHAEQVNPQPNAPES